MSKYIKNIEYKEVEVDKVPPDNFYLTSSMPTYYRHNHKWILPKHSYKNCVPVLKNDNIFIKELKDLVVGDKVILNNKDSIHVDKNIFTYNDNDLEISEKYDDLIKTMKIEKENNGHITWVLGPSVVFDYDTRIALIKLAENGYINSLLAGNALATHDLEGSFLNTSLGQNIYTQENVPMGHYNHLDLLNEVRGHGSIDKFIESNNIDNGIIKTLNKLSIPFVLAGSIRDDGPLPEVYSSVSDSIDSMKEQLNKSTLIIGLATMLHNTSVASIAPSYIIKEDKIEPLKFYIVDITDKVIKDVSSNRDNIACTGFITNVQDFVVNLTKKLCSKEEI